tara:strand:+ start:2732 stop:3349 length:618 start_codon:yes stop_codon:yes gene_type:complete
MSIDNISSQLEFQRRSSELPYRDGVAVVAINSQNEVLIGKARGFRDIWKMSQGGVDPEEEKGQAALRELYEEFGADKVSILKKSEHIHRYDYPEHGTSFRGYLRGFRGQEFQWFLVKVDDNQEFDLVSNNPEDEEVEFANYKWVSPEEAILKAHNSLLPDYDTNESGGDPVTYQRQQIYIEVLKEFGLIEQSYELTHRAFPGFQR